MELRHAVLPLQPGIEAHDGMEHGIGIGKGLAGRVIELDRERAVRALQPPVGPGHRNGAV